jgi:hypothetical protein
MGKRNTIAYKLAAKLAAVALCVPVVCFMTIVLLKRALIDSESYVLFGGSLLAASVTFYLLRQVTTVMLAIGGASVMVVTTLCIYVGLVFFIVRPPG